MSLFLPFEIYDLPKPYSNQHFLGFGLTEIPDQEWIKNLEIVTPWRPDFLKFTNAKFRCSPQINQTMIYDGALLQLSKYRDLNHNRFLDLLERVKPGGWIIVSGEKTVGSASIMKWIKTIVPISKKLSKNHSHVFWIQVPQQIDKQNLTHFRSSPLSFENKFQTTSGMFSHGRIDPGSAALVPYIQKVISGKTADFGAGWGFLSYTALKVSKNLTTLDLYEADYNALETAKKNMKHITTSIPISFYWHDLVCEPIKNLYDTIISNPPFHTQKATDISLGKHFITNAAKYLKPKGHFLLVANRHLPYEKLLKKLFRTVFIHEEVHGFKIIEARR
ncbi:ribosomal RNA small subunit methyltransferase C [Bartonella clarridgeiae 73]|uniref:Ribosomal RNA small subunit methyltransferase C n=1 Tax=Bartonella clarridgeiae (strain CCUG 45776 / CIP 104772 / 73) TaxID=696125 RepID=E6YG45_BARC7|nr:class I SAM-dependent methyltransferase [Bartonella clarridgeiae]WCR55559.1 MAG: 16S rRNA (guanine(1207)-N(2))-methyltransferase [Bartonella clarridgeiae]CBI75833.1 ribosomal RNA small subunit methyltransferase C [Bartonella clarridgeiae 73]